MSRRKVTKRVNAPADAVTLRCRCGARLGIAWPHEDGHGNGRRDDFASFSLVETGCTWQSGSIIAGSHAYALHGMKDIAHDDWNSITCRRCKHVWQGRDRYVHDLLRSARGGEIRLGQRALAQPDTTNVSSRDW